MSDIRYNTIQGRILQIRVTNGNQCVYVKPEKLQMKLKQIISDVGVKYSESKRKKIQTWRGILEIN